MTKVSEQRMKLRIEYSRETDLIFSDNIPAYADWLEQKLALRQPPVVGQSEQLVNFLWEQYKIHRIITKKAYMLMVANARKINQ